jgi:Na+-exporting ATPase
MTNEKGKPAVGMHSNTDDAPPHTLPATDLLSRFGVDPIWGLTEGRAQEVLLRNGPNRLRPPQKPSRMKIFLAQVLNAMTIVLIAATAVSFAVMDWISGGVIVLLVVVNVYVGYSRERLLLLATGQGL